MPGVVETRTSVVRWLLAGAPGAILLWILGLETKMSPMLIYPGHMIFDWRLRRITSALQMSHTEVRPAQR
mgnify:CR=1 FL=1